MESNNQSIKSIKNRQKRENQLPTHSKVDTCWVCCSWWNFCKMQVCKVNIYTYGHLPPITKTIQVRRTRHVGHCWRSRDELISDVLLWTPSYGRVKAGRPTRTYIQQFSEDKGCSPQDLPGAMNDREGGERRSGISVLMARQDDDI